MKHEEYFPECCYRVETEFPSVSRQDELLKLKIFPTLSSNDRGE